MSDWPLSMGAWIVDEYERLEDGRPPSKHYDKYRALLERVPPQGWPRIHEEMAAEIARREST